MMKLRAGLKAVLLCIAVLFAVGSMALAESVLTMPADLEVIEEMAFYGDTSITKVVLNEGVTEIRSQAFAYCPLKEIVMPASVTYIAEDAFIGCGNIVFTTDAGTYAETWAKTHGMCVREGDFIYRVISYIEEEDGAGITDYTGDLTAVTVPAYLGGYPVHAIDDAAFSHMETLTSVSLPEGLRIIGQYAFNNCIQLSSINLPDTLTYISGDAFVNCELTEFYIPPLVDVIYEYTFAGNEFETIVIPDHVTEIQRNAFYDNENLTSVTIPTSVTSIGDYAFDFCPKLEVCYYGGTQAEWEQLSIGTGNYYLEAARIVFTDGEKASTRFQWSIDNGVLTVTGQGESEEYWWIGESGISAPWSERRGEITEIVVGEGITSLRGPAFGLCSGVQKVTLPSTLKTIGNTVFDECSALESITIPDGVESIGSCAFYGCLGLQEVYIPDSVTSIGLYAFEYCPLTDVYYAGSQGQWQMIEGLESASIPADAVLHFAVMDGVEGDFGYVIENDECIVTSYVGTDTVITIPAEIAGYPVREVNISLLNADSTENTAIRSITEVNLPDSVQRLGDGAFRDWTGLKTVNGLESVQTIGEYCFSGSGVTSLEFSAALSYAGLYAFDANELRTLTIPDTLTWKGLGELTMYEADTIFWNHEQLAYINLITTGGTPTLAMHGPALYTADMRTLVCYPCKNPLNSYVMPEGVVNSYSRAFDVRDIYDTSGLYEVYVPESMTGLSAGTFYQDLYVAGADDEVQNVLLPRLVVQEGSEAHNWCLNEGSFTLYWRLADEVTLETKIQQVISQTITEDMSDWDKALALNNYLVDNVVYDDTLSLFGAGDALLGGVATCQGYTLAYGELLSACGIENGIVKLDSLDHCFNSALLNGEWCYIDVTWNDTEDEDCYFGMSAETVMTYYGVDVTTLSE